MKYLYVLVSDEQDFYLEQCMFSIYSLKNKMPDSFAVVLSDTGTTNRINRNTLFVSVVNEVKTVDYPKALTKKEGSRWLKTSMRQYVDDDFLYIDCDTVIMDDLSDISRLNINLGAVLDNHLLLSQRFANPYEKRLLHYRDKKAGFFSSHRVEKFFNGGLVFSRDCEESYVFFRKWHELWMLSNSKKISDDQPAFNQANFLLDSPIKELNGIWNCQIHYGGLSFLENAKILHYYIDPRWEKPLYIINNSFFEKLRERSCSKDELDGILFHIKSSFSVYTRLIADKNILTFLDTAAFSVLRRLFKYKWVVSFDTAVSRLFRFFRQIKAFTAK
jgi:lipopolysaccharide biosynthesis glycosyltransferase